MENRDIIVVGASAGGVAALKDFIKGLPEDFNGSIFIVLHMPPYAKSMLPKILSKAGPLDAVESKDGESIRPGTIYVAPNDHHLILESGDKIVVKRGPKENRFRPSIDALFRSAAYVYGSRVIGIILSGLLNDGVSGLWTIKQHGGIAVIQDPKDAEQPQLPENVLEYVHVDYIVSTADMAPLIAGMVKKPPPERHKLPEEELRMLKKEIVIATKDNAFEMGIMNMGEITPFTCPQCHGALVRLVEGKLIRFRCHTGHAYTASSLLSEATESVESMLWQSMRGMEEIVMLLENIAEHFEEMESPDAAALFKEKAEGAANRARIIHDSIFRQEQYSEDIRY
jgi:two-component system, chemotaxis family, protein-glutamate methylesterase/glutaminase